MRMLLTLFVLASLAILAVQVHGQLNSATTSTVNVTTAFVQSPTDLTALLNVSPTGDIMLNWTTANTSVFNYVIYKTENYTDGFNFSQMFGTTPDNRTTFTDTTANGTDQRFYVVRTNNTFGQQDSNSFAVGKWNIKLSTGFNLVSFPLVLDPSNATVYVTYIALGGDQVWLYDATDLLDPYKKADYFAGLGWYGDPSALVLEQERGYWYNSQNPDFTTDQFNWTITGRVAPSATRSIPIYNGFNLVGATTLRSMNISTFWTQPVAADQIWRYDAFDLLDPYKKSDYYAGFGWFGDIYFVDPGRGYWYNSMNSTTYSQEYQP